jgi:hypothetical protein
MGAASPLAVEEHPPCRNELQQDRVIADICAQHHQPELLSLQEQHAVLKRPLLAVLFVPLQAAREPDGFSTPTVCINSWIATVKWLT